jgi:hypothetical protein
MAAEGLTGSTLSAGTCTEQAPARTNAIPAAAHLLPRIAG